MDRLVLKNNDNLRLSNGPIPITYTELEWIESTGDEQWIDTGIIPDTTVRDIQFITKVYWTNTSRNYNWSGGNNGKYFGITSGHWTGSTSGPLVSQDVWYDLHYTSHISGSTNTVTYVVDGEEIFSTTTDRSSFTAEHILIFALGGTSGKYDNSHMARCRFGVYEIKVDGVTVRKYYPCRRNSDNAIGMYDAITDTFQLSSSTATSGTQFTAGPSRKPFSTLVTESLQSLLISNCPLINSLDAMASIYNNEEGGVANNQLNHFYLEWPNIQEKDATVLAMLTQIAQNKAVDGTTRVFHGMKLADGTNDDTIAPVIDGDLKMTGGIYMTSLDGLGVDPSETEDYGEGLKRAFAHYFRDLRVIYDPNKMFIEFADPEVLRICLANYDTNQDGGISTGEAQAVGSLSGNSPFSGNTIIETFDELRYFTGMTYISGTNIGGAPAPFKNCTSLKRISIPEGVLNIGMNAFNGCSALEEISFPISLVRIGYEGSTTTARNNAFQGCTAIERINYPGTPSQWAAVLFGTGNIDYNHPNTGGNAVVYFDGQPLTEITINNNVKAFAFYKMKQFTSLTIHDGVTSIGQYAFYNCTGIESVGFGSGLTSIGNYAFYGCAGLSGDIFLPSGLTSISQYAFFDCNNINSIHIPSSVTTIDTHSIEGTNLKKIIFEDSSALTTISSYAFNGRKVNEINLPSTITTIGRNAFAYFGDGATDIVPLDINLPNLTSLDTYQTFLNCKLVRHILNLGTVTSTSISCFGGCTNLESAVLPASLTNLKNGSFGGCTKLKSITIERMTPPPTLGTNVFNNVPNGGTLIIPPGASSNYASLPSSWGNVANWTKVENYAEDGKIYITFNITTTGEQWIHYSSEYAISHITSVELLTSEGWVGVAITGAYDFQEVGIYTFRYLIPSSVAATDSNIFRGVPDGRIKSVNFGRGIVFYNTSGGTRYLDDVVIKPGVKPGAQSIGCTNAYIFDLKDYLLNAAAASQPVFKSGTRAHHLFLNGKEITELVIPDDVTSIPAYAFNYCQSMISVTVNQTTPPTCGTNAFANMATTCPIYVPASAVDTYKAATNWSSYASRIQAIPE